MAMLRRCRRESRCPQCSWRNRLKERSHSQRVGGPEPASARAQWCQHADEITKHSDAVLVERLAGQTGRQTRRRRRLWFVGAEHGRSAERTTSTGLGKWPLMTSSSARTLAICPRARLLPSRRWHLRPQWFPPGRGASSGRLAWPSDVLHELAGLPDRWSPRASGCHLVGACPTRIEIERPSKTRSAVRPGSGWATNIQPSTELPPCSAVLSTSTAPATRGRSERSGGVSARRAAQGRSDDVQTLALERPARPWSAGKVARLVAVEVTSSPAGWVEGGEQRSWEYWCWQREYRQHMVGYVI